MQLERRKPPQLVDEEAVLSILESPRQRRPVPRRELKQRRKTALETITRLQASGTDRQIDFFEARLKEAQMTYQSCLITMPRWWRGPRMWLDRRTSFRRLAALTATQYLIR